MISDVFCSDVDVLPSWYFDGESSGGGILLAAGAHGLEQLLWLKDACRVEPLQTETRAVSGRGDTEDLARTYLYLDDTACHAEYSWKAGTRRHWTTTLYGNRGTVRIAPYGYARLVTTAGTEEAVFHPESAGYAERVGACTLSTMESLLAERTVPHRRHPTQSDLASHRRSLELVRALYSMTSTDTAR
jgi:predicted dehydrogenase